MKLQLQISCLAVLLLTSCTNSTVRIRNENQGRLRATVKLEVVEEKSFLLDDNTAPKPEYTQMYEAPDGRRYFTFLNSYNNSVYFYDYSTQDYVEKISWEKTGPNSIPLLKGYYIKSPDSIYVYNKHPLEIILTNSRDSIMDKISLLGEVKDKSQWIYFYYPQYYLQTVVPFIKTSRELLLTGFYYGVLPDSLISKFRFTARLDLKTNRLRFSNSYPRSLYGHNYNWFSEFVTTVYSDLHPDGDKLLLSFPVSHDIYLADLNTGEYTRIYAGSNYAGTICSIDKDPKNTTNEDMLDSFMKNDVYSAILYDRFREVYYRFMLKAMPDVTVHTPWKKKVVSVIVMDKDFGYLGETTVGPWDKWNWQNSFVTSEGLNIEYFGDDNGEDYIKFEIFITKNL